MIEKAFFPQRLLLATTMLAGTLWAQSSDAQIPTVHELLVVAHSESVPLDLVDRGLAPANESYQLTLLGAPRHGNLSDEDYLPEADFWLAGADQLTLEIWPAVGPVTRHTFLLAPAPSAVKHLGYSEDFDSESIMSYGWTVSGDASLVSYVNPGIENKSLMVYMSTAGAAADFGRTVGDESEGNHGIGAAGTTIAGPPENVQSDTTIPGWVNIATAGPSPTTSLIYVQLRLHDGVYSMRASTNADGDSVCAGCATPWRSVPAQLPVAFQLWSGPTVISADGLREPRLQFTLDLPGTEDDTMDWLSGFYDVSYARYGFRQSSGVQSLEVLFDNLESWREDLTFSSQTLIFDDFEQGGDSAWLIDGPVGIKSSAAQQGDLGVAINVDALRTGDPRDALLIDISPDSANPITQFSAQMTVDLSSLQLADGESIRLLCGSSTDDPEVGLHLSIILYRQNGIHKIWARARENVGTMHKTATHDLTTDTPRLTMKWRSSASSSGSGAVALWVDGISLGEVGGFDNDLKTLDSLAFGVFKPTFDPAIRSGGDHPILMDDLFVSAR